LNNTFPNSLIKVIMNIYIKVQILLCFVLIFISQSCGYKIKNDELSDYFTGHTITGKVNNLGITISDTIIITNINSSFLGFLQIEQDKIVYFDRIFGYVFYFDKNGEFIKRYLGKGRGPTDYPSSELFYHCSTADNKHILMDLFWNYFVYDKDWNLISKKHIDFQEDKFSNSELINKPNPNMGPLYEIDFSIPTIIAIDTSHILIPVLAQHIKPKWNSYSSLNHYKYFHIFGELDIKSGEMVRFFGRKSPDYLKYHYLPSFNKFYFDCTMNEIFITYEPDSLIYCISKDGKHKYSFGYMGRDMLTDYPETKTFEEAERTISEHRKKYSFYSSLKLIKKTDVLFRGYKKNNEKYAGLQAYKDTELLFDVNVPKTFKVIGYISPFYYASITTNDEDEKLIIYRFKINEGE